MQTQKHSTKCRKNGLEQQEVTYVGHVLLAEVTKADLTRLKQSVDVKGVQHFIGMIIFLT